MCILKNIVLHSHLVCYQSICWLSIFFWTTRYNGWSENEIHWAETPFELPRGELPCPELRCIAAWAALTPNGRHHHHHNCLHCTHCSHLGEWKPIGSTQSSQWLSLSVQVPVRLDPWQRCRWTKHTLDPSLPLMESQLHNAIQFKTDSHTL